MVTGYANIYAKFIFLNVVLIWGSLGGVSLGGGSNLYHAFLGVFSSKRKGGISMVSY